MLWEGKNGKLMKNRLNLWDQSLKPRLLKNLHTYKNKQGSEAALTNDYYILKLSRNFTFNYFRF